MKKYLWILFLLPCLCYGATGDTASVSGVAIASVSTINSVATASIATVCGKNYTDGDGGGGDSCTGNLKYSHHAENNDDATTSANGTQGCSASATYKSWTKNNATYTSTSGQYYDGSYGLSASGWAYYAYITTTGWLDITEKGSIEMWYEHDSTPHTSYLFEIYIDDNHYIWLKFNTDGTFTLGAKDGTNTISKTTTGTLTAGGDIVKAGWDFSQAGGSDIMRIKIGSSAWEETTNYTITDIGTMPAALFIGGYTISTYGYYDRVKVWTSANCE